MKKNLVVFLLLTMVSAAYAQEAKRSLLFDLVNERRQLIKGSETVSLFKNAGAISTPEINASLSRKNLLVIDKPASLRLFASKPESISFSFPISEGNSFTLELLRQDINTTNEFSFGTLEGSGVKKMMGTEQGLHYRGYIAGDPSSLACISIFENGDIMGIFCNKDGNYNIGKSTANNAQYILYNSQDLNAPLKFECGTSESLPPGVISDNIVHNVPTPSAIPALLCRKVRIYWEADYKLYSNNFSLNLAETKNYLTGLFNQVATMYQNEGILIELTDTYIWITEDPYNTSTSSNGLASLKNRWNALGNSFKADLAVLIDGAPTNNGGVAYLLTNALCNREYAYGYADVYGFYSTVPVYSWDVEVVTHEMGHMMGSHHTHWCGWNTGVGGACGAIDNCTTTESAGASCTSCAATTNTNPTAPAGFKGTVMSYCHLRSGIGINLANGFGPLPQDAIRTTVSIANCAIRDNKWTGAISTAWEDPANWGCGLIPDASTDVTIESGLLRYPVVNSAAVCRRIIQAPSTSVLVKTGFTLMVAGLPSNP